MILTIITDSAHDDPVDFFTLGGDSFKATRFVEVLRGKHGPIVSLRSFFAAPTVAAVAEALEADVEEGAIQLVWRPM